MDFQAGQCDVAVIGAGHAGIEAALACARMGLDTVCFTINLDAVGNMPCNPSIGGTGKGHLVRELDALGGEMAKAADKTCLQYRLLNRGKGPAVYSHRAQADRREYQRVMKHTLEKQQNLRLKQAEIVEIGAEGGEVRFVKTQTGGIYRAKAVIVCTGTYLRGRTIVGDVIREGGPDGMFAATVLSKCLAGLGLSLRRFKTGTPPRINGRTVDYSKMEIQPGDSDAQPFSFETETVPENRVSCYLTYTNAETHRIIRENLDRSPLYSGVIEGIGPRYCPSIEDKVVRFSDKPRHQLFIEPMGLGTEEVYVQGFSSSMPEEVQIKMLHTIKGLDNAEIMRPAYAIEYDCVDPLELLPTLETRKISGLYGAGQFNGTSGYEEAAVQGFIAGVNAALKIKGKPPLIIDRSEAYIGTLIDDLVTKGTNEPYRMMTSRGIPPSSQAGTTPYSLSKYGYALRA
jgi:tRNA uridine 5-carboxymethylaminomethyl modification enzyme